jgi:hypothetical protein
LDPTVFGYLIVASSEQDPFIAGSSLTLIRSAALFAVFKIIQFQMLTWENAGVECSGRERSAGVGERGGATAPAPQGQAHQAAEARDRVQEGQISG